MPTPDESVTLQRKRNFFYHGQRAESIFVYMKGCVFLKINISKVVFFYFMLHIKVKTFFFGNIFFKSVLPSFKIFITGLKTIWRLVLVPVLLPLCRQTYCIYLTHWYVTFTC